MIFDQDPQARAKSLHASLAPVADKLRRQGATVEFIFSGSPTHQHLLMMITLRCPIREAVVTSAKLERIATNGGGTIYGNLLSLPHTSVPDGEYRFALGFSVMKACAA